MARIVVRDLTKRFSVAERRPGLWGAVRGIVARRTRTIDALAGVSFCVGEGEVVGYVGPNGAGKSTTIKVLSGIIVPDGGHCEVLGRTPWTQRIDHVREIGAVFGQRTQLWWDLPAIESFELLRELYRVPMADYRRRTDDLIDRLALADVIDTPVRQLSLGQRMRCDLVAALLHDPPVLFLDEPTIGLDAVAKQAMRAFVREINAQRGTTVLLTTHDMDDIEALCHRVLVIDRGRVVSRGTLDDLRARVGGQRWLTAEFEQPLTKPPQVAEATVRSHEGRRVQLAFDPAAIAPDRVVAQLGECGVVRDLWIENPPIEDIIATLYRESAGEGGGA